jgi:hypothetical protein
MLASEAELAHLPRSLIATVWDALDMLTRHAHRQRHTLQVRFAFMRWKLRQRLQGTARVLTVGGRQFWLTIIVLGIALGGYRGS